MLPTPFEKFIPKIYRRDSGLVAMSDKADTHISDWKADILRIASFIDPARIPNNLLVEVGDMLSAGIGAEDSDRIKREKIVNAVVGHKQRGLWVEDVKPKVDAVAGGDAQLFPVVGQDDFILVGDGNTPSTHFWSILGGDGAATDYGIRLVGEGEENVLKGVILIDVDNSLLFAAEVDQIRLTIEDSVPAYYIVKLGYIESGLFIEYIEGQIDVVTSLGEGIVTSGGVPVVMGGD